MNNTKCSICLESLYKLPEPSELNTKKYPIIAITKCKHISHLKCITTGINPKNDGYAIEERTICIECKQVATPLSIVFNDSDTIYNFSDKPDYIENFPLSACNPSSMNYFKKLSREYPLFIQGTFYSKEFNSDISLLMYAVLKGYLEVIKFLISKGANINQIHPKYETALYQSVQQKDNAIFEELINAGATFRTTDEYADEMVEIALNNNHGYIISGLIVSPDDEEFIYCWLEYAVQSNCYNAIDLLIKKSDDFGLPYIDRTNLLHLAITSSFPKIVSLLAQSMPNIDTVDKNENTAMLLAVKNRLLSMVKILINFPAKTITLKNALLLAVDIGDKDIVIELLKKFKTIVASSDLNSVLGLLLFHAVRHGHTNMVKILCDELNGDEANYINPTPEWCALSYLANIGNTEMLEILCSKKGVDPNKTSGNVDTPLLSAIFEQRLSSAEILLRHGADPNLGRSPATMSSKPIGIACQNGDLEMVKLLVKYRVKVDTPRANTLSPLDIAAQYGHHEIVKLLLQQGAKPDTPHVDDETALIQASQYGHTNVAEVLLDAGADHSIQNKRGHTALHIASKYGNLAVVELLLKKGADSNIKNEKRQTACDIACLKGHQRIAELLKPKTLAMETYV
jgi:ankyrin repeat protein